VVGSWFCPSPRFSLVAAAALWFKILIMRLSPVFLFFSLCLCGLGQTQPATDRQQPAVSDGHASVEGVIINSTTGEPMGHVHVRMMAGSSDGTPTTIYGAMSNEKGQFSINPLQPETYFIFLGRAGFVSTPSRDRNVVNGLLTVKPGQQIKDLKLQMAPSAVISGHVFNEYGDPVWRVQVRAIAAKPESVGEQVQSMRTGTTNERGEFRLSGPPGSYYISVYPGSSGGQELAEVRTDGTAESRYRETYYPSAANKDSAVPVAVKAGGEHADVDIHLRHFAPLAISGRVSGPPEGVMAVSISLESGRTSRRVQSSQTIGNLPDEKGEWKFLFANLGEGFYRVYANCSTGDRQFQSQIVEFNLTNASIDNINLVLSPGLELAGKIEAPGTVTAESKQLGARVVKLIPQGSPGEMRASTGEVAGDGSFKITGLFPELYRVSVEPLPENAYIKALSLGGQEPPNRLLDFQNGVRDAKLKITLGANGGRISGTVQDKDGQPARWSGLVVLMPDQKDVDRSQMQFDRISGKGAYSFKGLVPGRYRVIAMDFRSSGSWEDEDWLKKYGSTGEIVEIKEGDRISRDLKVGAGEPTDAKSKQ
jgi:hypothetical protein